MGSCRLGNCTIGKFPLMGNCPLGSRRWEKAFGKIPITPSFYCVYPLILTINIQIKNHIKFCTKQKISIKMFTWFGLVHVVAYCNIVTYKFYILSLFCILCISYLQFVCSIPSHFQDCLTYNVSLQFYNLTLHYQVE